MGLDREQLSISLRAKGLIKTESGEWVKANSVAPRIPDAKSEHPIRETLGNANEIQKQSTGRAIVCFTLFRTIPLDPSNANGSIKAIEDALRYAAIVQDDTPEHIEITVKQKKVAHRKDEGTLIEVTYP